MKEDINRGLQIARRHTLASYIRTCGRLYGEDHQFMNEYVKEQVAAWEHDLETAISCFKHLVEDKQKFMKGRL